MKCKHIIIAAIVSMTFTGCGLYNKYEKTVKTPDDVFGASMLDSLLADVDTSYIQPSWREFFTDPLLQQLIEQALANNTDLNTARIAVEKSKASLRQAKLAYLPSLSLSPQGTLSKFDNGSWSKSYSLPLELSMNVEVFGSITSKKRAARAVLLQSQMTEESTRSNLISSVAQQYCYLQLLDRQLAILIETDSLWKASLEMEKVLWESGQVNSTAVNQQESSYLSVKNQIIDTRLDILNTEDDICSLLAITPQHIRRSRLDTHDAQLTTLNSRLTLHKGISAKALLLRPDIRMANYTMEEAFYNTQAARAAFFPSLSLSGTAGWTNNGGGMVSNPGALLLKAIGSLTQPIFARGQLKANKQMAQLTEEDMQKKYVQTVLNAGRDVNKAIAQCQASREKNQHYRRQVEVLHKAYDDTHYLMDNGEVNYLEVLTAQEKLLTAQLNEATNIYNGAQAVIALYIALGGGTK